MLRHQLSLCSRHHFDVDSSRHYFDIDSSRRRHSFDIDFSRGINFDFESNVSGSNLNGTAFNLDGIKLDVDLNQSAFNKPRLDKPSDRPRLKEPADEQRSATRPNERSREPRSDEPRSEVRINHRSDMQPFCVPMYRRGKMRL